MSPMRSPTLRSKLGSVCSSPPGSPTRKKKKDKKEKKDKKDKKKNKKNHKDSSPSPEKVKEEAKVEIQIEEQVMPEEWEVRPPLIIYQIECAKPTCKKNMVVYGHLDKVAADAEEWEEERDPY
jgi:hypothetical protein